MYEDEKELYLRIHGYPLNLENPKSYNEKIIHKKLFDRNPLITLTADKYRARGYIRDRIGWEVERHLVPLLYVTDNPQTIPFDKLPEQYIIKPNNAAGRWIVCEAVDEIKKYEINYTREKRINLSNLEIIGYCEDWFKTVYGVDHYEWAYQEIEPLIIAERLLCCKNGKIPSDFRVCMFGGKCKMIYVTTPNQETFSYYDENWEPMDIIRVGHKLGKVEEKPKEFDKMMAFAEKLSYGWDFIRCDFFIIDDWIYFSELTHYPAGGYGKLPKDIDFELGRYWGTKK